MLAETRAVVGNLKGVPEGPERGSTKASFMSAAIYVAYGRKTARRVEVAGGGKILRMTTKTTTTTTGSRAQRRRSATLSPAKHL